MRCLQCGRKVLRTAVDLFLFSLNMVVIFVTAVNEHASDVSDTAYFTSVNFNSVA